jgi:hypothetical protein
VGLWVVLAVLALHSASPGRAQQASEYQVKAAFLYNFTKFVEWPAEVFPSADAPLQICVLGQDRFGRDFDDLIAGRIVNGHRLQALRLSDERSAKACQIVFIASSDKREMQRVLQGLKGTSILTVGDTAGFADMGGMINFVLDGNRVRFEINPKAAEQARLKLSARLLTVAKLVGERGGN